MTRLAFWVVVLLSLGLAAGCASSAPRSASAFESAEDVATLDDDENRFWLMSNQMDVALQKQGALYGDPELDAYLQSLIDKLFPDFEGKMRIRAIKDPNLNAFAMANGSLYINTGMLARLNNEAELAAVLGHEGIHFTDRHVIQGMRQQKKTAVLVNMVAMTGYGLVGSMVGVSSVLGYSRSTEAEADVRGFERMLEAGYDVKSVADSFARFAREIDARDEKGVGFFATHPSMEARASAFATMARLSPKGGRTFDDRFLTRTYEARMDALEALAERGEVDALIHILETEDRLHLFPIEARYYLGEGYRKRNEEGDMEKAEALYRELASPGEQYGPAFGRLGFILMQRNENEAALTHFKRYLELTPEAKDKAYIENYIETLTGS